jgi:hypothetical protein
MENEPSSQSVAAAVRQFLAPIAAQMAFCPVSLAGFLHRPFRTSAFSGGPINNIGERLRTPSIMTFIEASSPCGRCFYCFRREGSQ